MTPETKEDVALRHPASYPFLLVDKVLGIVPGERGVGLRNVTANDPLLAGGGRRPHTLRRGLLFEAFTQLASMILGPDAGNPAHVDVKKIDAFEFQRSPVPGDQVVLTIELTRSGDSASATCAAETGGVKIAGGAMEIDILPDDQ